MSNSGKEEKKSKRGSHKSTKSGTKNNTNREKAKDAKTIDDLDPESYLEAMSYSIYGYKQARYDTENPKNLFQAESMPPLRRPHEDHRFKCQLVYGVDQHEEQELQEYLEFVHKFMKEQAMVSTGSLLVGSSGFEERALKLLEK